MNNVTFSVSIKDGVAVIKSNFTSKKKIKILVQKGSSSNTYEFAPEITIPLTLGNGRYSFLLCENLSGNSYKVVKQINKDIKLKDINQFKTMPNSYVSYENQPLIFEKAKSLGSLNNIKNYINNSMIYDYVKALMIRNQSLAFIKLDDVYVKRKGTCYDLAALATAMFRICGYPATLVFGYANKAKHAWVEINGTIYDPTKCIQHNKKTITYTPIAYY